MLQVVCVHGSWSVADRASKRRPNFGELKKPALFPNEESESRIRIKNHDKLGAYQQKKSSSRICGGVTNRLDPAMDPSICQYLSRI